MRCQVLIQHLEHALAGQQAEYVLWGNMPDTLAHEETLAVLAQLSQIQSLNRPAL